MAFLTTFSDESSKTYKDAARTATTGPINLLSAPASIGSVNLNLNDRVLVKDQLNAEENGIYVFNGAGSPMVRSKDANSSREVLPNMLISVSEGDYEDKIFELTTNGPIILDTTPLSFGLAILPIDLTTDVVGVLPVANGGTNKSSWTEGRVVFAGASGSALTEDSEFNWINSTKRLGIGTSSPNSKVQINNSGSQMGLAVYSTSSNNTAELFNQGTTNYTLALNSAANSAQTGASIGGYFARGTLGSRQQTLANDVLLSITASGYTGSAFAPSVSAGFVIAADQNTTAGGFGGQVSIVTTPNDTLGLPLPRLTVKNDGNVGIGITSPTEKLQVAGNTKTEGLLLQSRHNLTGAVTVLSNDYYVGCNSSGGAVTVALQAAATAKQGRKLVIKAESSLANVTINAAAGETIDGLASHVLNVSYESVTLVCNGANAWFIV
jgi:hypothetical protein